jgi:lipoyl(octanoyl) transferase
LGQVAWADCLALQRRLVYEAGEGPAGPVLLICEHPPLVTIGRGGSRGHLRLTDAELADRGLEVQRVARGGGCILHLPGQLAIYPIVSLEDHGLSVGAFVGGLQLAIQETLIELRYPALVRPGTAGIWGRTGQLAALGVAVRQGVAYHGAFLNVSPELRLFRYVQTDPRDPAPMSSLLAERSRPARMSAVRAELIPRLATALGCSRYHLYTGHPLLKSPVSDARGTAAHRGP